MLNAAVLTAICCLFLASLAGADGKNGTKTAKRGKLTVGLTKKGVSSRQESDCNKWNIVKGIRFYRASMWMWQWQEGTGMGRVTKWRPRHSCEFLNYLAVRAKSKSLVARRHFNVWFSRIYAKWECIHSLEGAWNDPNSPYWGGLQMDLSFQQSHGPTWYRIWGTANNWPVWAQLRAAEDAYHGGRGYNPWPTTARNCGLL